MGYDMSFVAKPTGEEERVAAVRQVLHAAYALRDAMPGVERGRYTEEEFHSGDLETPPANASARYKAIRLATNHLYELMGLEEISYFRLNIWGMSRYATAMNALDMVYDSTNELGWPNHKPYPDDAAKQALFEAATAHLEYGEELTEAIPDEVMEVAQRHGEEQRAVLRHHPAGGDTIPLHKFGSNDGWIVTPDEITAALKAYEANPNRDVVVAKHIGDGDRRDYWDRWIAYLRTAASHDGFEVH